METRHKFSFFLERTEKDGDRRRERERNGRKTERREERKKKRMDGKRDMNHLRDSKTWKTWMEESDNKRVNKSFPILSSYSSFSPLMSTCFFSLFYPSLSLLFFSRNPITLLPLCFLIQPYTIILLLSRDSSLSVYSMLRTLLLRSLLIQSSSSRISSLHCL